ncbi:hypothetical protein K1T35_48265 (plasmid) [Pseudonocardia sp. DSM 110487]|uniref:hypothetical protein n=1 Tax=Pseudonocardia sp. DSM 110487 TaxID=2865833 RepID=UPI001C6A4434|nr:hypothetical protein [Pseudonocardia sp. DSM 110487]QYN41144.1 hypothetical protein K1T35_48265 [Pseudonocardia sp. DSM 110487]
MIREEKFRISRRPYAVDLSSMKITPPSDGYGRSHRMRVDAAWFRRRSGFTVACVGQLWGYLGETEPRDAAHALELHVDGRYGGDCHGRWDGAGYWGMEQLEDIERHVALLRPMLENYPALPPGYDGWWRF